jgi:hypothetical protein
MRTMGIESDLGHKPIERRAVAALRELTGRLESLRVDSSTVWLSIISSLN